MFQEITIQDEVEKIYFYLITLSFVKYFYLSSVIRDLLKVISKTVILFPTL